MTSTPNVEIYGYNIIFDQDKDILNQGTVEHIKRYFEKKEQQDKKYDTYQEFQYMHLKLSDQSLSINNITFFVKLFVVIILFWIIWDFLHHEKIENYNNGR